MILDISKEKDTNLAKFVLNLDYALMSICGLFFL